MKLGKYRISLDREAIREIVVGLGLAAVTLVATLVLGFAAVESGVYNPGANPHFTSSLGKYIYAGVGALIGLVIGGAVLFSMATWLLDIEVKKNDA